MRHARLRMLGRAGERIGAASFVRHALARGIGMRPIHRRLGREPVDCALFMGGFHGFGRRHLCGLRRVRYLWLLVLVVLNHWRSGRIVRRRRELIHMGRGGGVHRLRRCGRRRP